MLPICGCLLSTTSRLTWYGVGPQPLVHRRSVEKSDQKLPTLREADIVCQLHEHSPGNCFAFDTSIAARSRPPFAEPARWPLCS